MRVGLLCRTLVRRNSHLCSGAALEQTRLLYVYNNCFGARQIIMCEGYMYKYINKILVHAQDSCACTTLVCMHWAREPRGQGLGLGPNEAAGPVPGPGPLPFWVPGLAHGLVPGPWVPWPSASQERCACTRVLRMHKNLVYAQESWKHKFKLSRSGTFVFSGHSWI